jgi:hypothetical protein
MMKQQPVKGEIVTIQLPKTEAKLAAVITKSTTSEIIIETDKGDGEIIGFSAKKNKIKPERLVAGLKVESGTQKPLSDALRKAIDAAGGKGPSVSKGQIVSYKLDGEYGTGRVVKGGKEPKVTTKNETYIQGPARQFTPIEASEPVNPELSDWEVTAFKEEGVGRDFERWTATVAYKGTDSFFVICDGGGGCLDYEVKSRKRTEADEQRKLIGLYMDTLKEYVEAHGESSTVIDELYPTYDWEFRPTGLTFINYVKDLHK